MACVQPVRTPFATQAGGVSSSCDEATKSQVVTDSEHKTSQITYGLKAVPWNTVIALN